jgi:hypothetical protein
MFFKLKSILEDDPTHLPIKFQFNQRCWRGEIVIWMVGCQRQLKMIKYEEKNLNFFPTIWIDFFICLDIEVTNMCVKLQLHSMYLAKVI